MKWVTLEFVHVDRTACPWLIRKFIDPKAEFIFTPPEKIDEAVKTQGAIPFDVRDVPLGHRNGKCSFILVSSLEYLGLFSLLSIILLFTGLVFAVSEVAKTKGKMLS